MHYPTRKLEFLALKWAITDKFHDYLYCSHFDVFTDNYPLTYILSTARLDATGHRWLAHLSNYDFDIHYKSGATNADADALSRLPELRKIESPTVTALCEASKSSDGYIFSLLADVPAESSVVMNLTNTVNIAQVQSEDPCLRQIINWKKNNQKPHLELLQDASSEVKKLVCE